MSLRTLYFFTLLLAVLAFGPSFGHALEAANKLALDRQGYLVVQQLYRGWAFSASSSFPRSCSPASSCLPCAGAAFRSPVRWPR